MLRDLGTGKWNRIKNNNRKELRDLLCGWHSAKGRMLVEGDAVYQGRDFGHRQAVSGTT